MTVNTKEIKYMVKIPEDQYKEIKHYVISNDLNSVNEFFVESTKSYLEKTKITGFRKNT